MTHASRSRIVRIPIRLQYHPEPVRFWVPQRRRLGLWVNCLNPLGVVAAFDTAAGAQAFLERPV